jgi:hypothetical protein
MRHTPIALVVTLLLSMSAIAQASGEAAPVEEARGIVNGLAQDRLGELQGALKVGGPVTGINVCNIAAPAIAMKAARASGRRVGRMALKIRNRANSPDAWERRVLEGFLVKAAQGADLTKLEHHEIVSEGGARVLRYMKAIPVAEPCLTCHGADVRPEIRAAIAAHYPQDQATGFKLGNLRGAFTLSRTLK